MQRKLRLEDLAVESFATTTPADAARGTVYGRDSTQPPNCASGQFSCLPGQSCEETCGMSCDGTCVNCTEGCSTPLTCDCA